MSSCKLLYNHILYQYTNIPPATERSDLLVAAPVHTDERKTIELTEHQRVVGSVDSVDPASRDEQRVASSNLHLVAIVHIVSQKLCVLAGAAGPFLIAVACTDMREREKKREKRSEWPASHSF